MSSPTRLNTKEFDRTLSDYMKVSKREFATVLNTKGFFIARRAVVETVKANKIEIRQYYQSGAIIGRIINKRRGLRGEKGLYGAAMDDAVMLVLTARLKSVAFLKSGWLPAIKTLGALIPSKHGAARQDRTAKIVGKEKGKAIPARPGFRIVATIQNAASGDHDKKQALIKYGLPALQRAFDFEVRSMKEYLARKLQQSARKLGIRTR